MLDENGQTERVEALASAIESILLVASEPVSIRDISASTDATRAEVLRALHQLRNRSRGGIRVQEHAGRLQLVTAPENADTVRRFLGALRPAPLSRAALETLAVVAYRQPVTRSEIDSTRAVDSDRALRTLLTRGLVEEVGRRRGAGRAAEYGTTQYFLEYFGLSAREDLPPTDLQPVAIEAAALGLRTQESGQDVS